MEAFVPLNHEYKANIRPHAENLNPCHLQMKPEVHQQYLIFLKQSNPLVVLNIFTSWREFNLLMAPNILRI